MVHESKVLNKETLEKLLFLSHMQVLSGLTVFGFITPYKSTGSCETRYVTIFFAQYCTLSHHLSFFIYLYVFKSEHIGVQPNEENPF